MNTKKKLMNCNRKFTWQVFRLYKISEKARSNLNLMLFLWFTQIFFVFWGGEYFGKFLNPFFLFLNNFWFILLYFKNIQQAQIIVNPNTSNFEKKILFLLFIVLVSVTVLNFQKSFQHYQHPVEYSDIIPQLDSQYHRFKEGVTVYKTVILPYSKPFPVYMPFHWLPIGVTDSIGIDSRWSGVLILMISFAVYTFYVYTLKCKVNLKILLIFLPFLSVFAFFEKAQQDISVSLETIIAAYYLILAIGLMQRNLLLTIVGIILCLLSRYTLIFWLPLFLLALLLDKKYKKMFWVISIPIIALLVFYIKPFVFDNPEIFLTGLKYHNSAAAFEWEHGAWTFESGLYFAPHFNELINSHYEQKILITRVFQASVLIIVTIFGVFFYSKNKNKVNVYDFSLGMLYALLICFYIFSPLTYKYYMLTTLLISPILIMNKFVKRPERKSFKSS